ncbi:hypothetical protein H6G41_14990 [Tolypothrix sp. FACHB-123]|nr:hypothetical protein [Tolypothrix sp. FACHB-123]
MFTQQNSGRKTSLPLLVTISLAIISLLPIRPSLGENNALPQASDAPLELSLLTKPNNSVITASTISQRNLTIPSLWRAQNSAENKLLDNWIAYPASQDEPARVDLIVNQQIWSLLDYLERYDFINRLGTSARRDNYNIRVFNYQQELLGTYTCNFQVSPVSCNINMPSQNKLGWRRSF